MEEDIVNIYSYEENSEELKRLMSNDNKSLAELEKQDKLTEMLLDFYQRVYDKNALKLSFDYFSYDFMGYGYIKDEGYYAIYDGRFGFYEVTTFKENLYSAFFQIASNIIEKKSFENDLENHKKIKKEYKKRFPKINFLMDLYESEYAINIWNKYYEGDLPEEITHLYIDRLHNKDDLEVDYNFDNQELTVEKKPKTRVLKK